jgi:hypothetical protein
MEDPIPFKINRFHTLWKTTRGYTLIHFVPTPTRAAATPRYTFAEPLISVRIHARSLPV